ncbi:HEAT repeat domain-containing protein [Streptomyces sp. V4-01]|uniref:HEAT repeat domain-containing protein n=1 Tax=Actinacidiphila polyblastidii TaxID=3110430 RepID=A0ABU7P851_9ACTN|nr:HEAT repeat domain-containing protein [Streptomyces sp. V4-01]
MGPEETDVTALITRAAAPDPEKRAEAAFDLATAVTGRGDDPALAALIRLTRDTAPAVRDRAAFALGALADVDGPAVRAALAERLDDADRDTREEAVRGLALRRDPRAAPLLRELLEAGAGPGEAHPHTVEAAAVLADAALLPALRRYPPQEPGVAEALDACDPRRRALRDRGAAALLEEVHRLLPGADAAVSAHRMEAAPTLTMTVAGDPLTWNVDRLLARADGDPLRAAALVVRDAGALPSADRTA